MTFADKIKYARVELNLSQERFANLLGVSFATVNRLEKGRIKYTNHENRRQGFDFSRPDPDGRLDNRNSHRG